MLWMQQHSQCRTYDIYANQRHALAFTAVFADATWRPHAVNKERLVPARVLKRPKAADSGHSSTAPVGIPDDFAK